MEINKIDPWMTSLRQEMSASVHFLQMASWQLMVSNRYRQVWQKLS
jgi:hypothetical protein